MKAELLKFLRVAYDERVAYVKKNKLQAYRLADLWDIALPAIVDIYQDYAVIFLLGSLEDADVADLEEVLREIVGVKGFFYKNKAKEDIQMPKSSPHTEIILEEFGAKFKINLSDYMDTGLFLDHRETRRWVAGLSEGKVVLNTFAYTGSFSVHAGLAGAEMTHSVDLSKTYCGWIRENLELNGLAKEKHWVYMMDTFEFYRYAKRKGLSFDIVVIDPPTFSKNKNEHFSVQKDHRRLIEGAFELLKEDGMVVFSNNYLRFEMGAMILVKYDVEEITGRTIPEDFALLGGEPIHRCFVIKRR